MSGQSPLPRLVADGPDRWRIEAEGGMHVPGIVFASEALLPHIEADQVLRQVVNVACLPGVVEASYAMPDIHSGYGFPIGGVAATDVDDGGVVSPGGVGFDISCGVRLLAAPLARADLDGRLEPLMDALERRLPHGLGPGGVWSEPDEAELEKVLMDGSRFVVERGFGDDRDLDRCEDRGSLDGAAPEQVSRTAKDRGIGQLGSIGAGNHFAEVQWVDAVYDHTAAAAFGLAKGQVCVMIHCGSRGLGHQVCTDHVETMQRAMARYGIEVPDPQLAGVPVRSPEGEAYLGAMAAAANFGSANRQLLAHATRQAFAEVTGNADLPLVYDVSHNLAKLERHPLGDGADRLVCVQRKGATRAFGPGHPELPADLATAGQPVLVPGSMGTASYVLGGGSDGLAFASACHGAGRAMSRTQARKRIHGRDLRNQLEERDIRVRAGSWKGLAEEAPFSYKDVDEVVETCERAGLARRVARLRPLGVVKG